MGGKIQAPSTQGRGPYNFKIGGQNHHLIGSLLPNEGSRPKFSQLYIYDTEHEIANRKAAYSSRNPENFEDPLIAQLQDMIDEHNPLAKNFRMARDRFISDSCQNVRLQRIGRRDTDGRTYNLPTTYEVAALIVGDIDTADKRDIIIETRNGKLKQISELRPSYLPLQYPLLFPYGEDGYRVDVFHRDKNPPTGNSKKRDRLTMGEWFAYRMQDRKNEAPTILLSRRLCQQFCVNGYTMMEAKRLSFVKYNQQSFRADNVKNLRGETERGDTEGASTGSRALIPAAFTGGHSYMRENHQDAMAICRWYGFPDLFITFTCNPKWPEITRFVSKRGLRPKDRPDIICRVFKMKLDQLVKDLKDKNIFGRVRAVVYTIEFQKRGLPHAHILLFLHRDDKFPNSDAIDKIICVELLNKDKNPELYDVVTEFMIHGPCGALNHDAPCTTEKKCTRNFPKRFNERTTVDEDGYPVYRRRDSGATVEKNGVMLDNRFVVPHNPELLSYQNRQNSEDPKEMDEIKMYYDCRYISPCEAMWRSLGFTIHYRTPTVERLSFHLRDEQTVLYTDDADLESLKNFALADIEAKLQSNGSTLRKFTGMPFPNDLIVSDGQNKLIMDELSYDQEQLQKEFQDLYAGLTDEPRGIYNEIIYAVLRGKGSVFFVYGYGGTGKTYMWRLLCAALRRKGEIVLPVASSGIASLLLPCGRAAHSRFGLPLNVDENSTCHGIKPRSDLTGLLMKTKLIIWDEAPMMHKYCFEALDRSLKDVMQSINLANRHIPFGGKVVVFPKVVDKILCFQQSIVLIYGTFIVCLD
ncbi:uncharacterized protein LOC125494758 [Beta vulgaris subsp. vulgaris]|uniref:uncharacterized protein LOC125494758 n=1 Tax=Beta vulgaris subsp. vulgaris TaxID=3555 RepID=UPI002548B41E|nr:uncharacterized protein LOC125494758 [Beta vulgaris subsp. vulgaris]